MKATFLVSITLDDSADLVGTAARISDRLEDEFAVITVKPWQRPKTAPDAQASAVMRSFITLPR
jgi:hypothetical protein